MSMKVKFQIFIAVGYVASITMLVTGSMADGINKAVALTLGVVGAAASVVLTFITWRASRKGKSL
ncbi:MULTISPECIES: hypothetical protein [unclassified Streptomyces]|uniref:hypothetical protein n=1 Tax=unclassified Streptomyces TaxID=2593676 RepID=UPI00234A48CF|nr:hypothetical protein [Streptomyces sp. M92]WCN05088.1 hypothetical protein M6G08_24895 [Streptomyces sp. M92]